MNKQSMAINVSLFLYQLLKDHQLPCPISKKRLLELTYLYFSEKLNLYRLEIGNNLGTSERPSPMFYKMLPEFPFGCGVVPY